MSRTLWAPIVYGRTDRVDKWWRAEPEGAPRELYEEFVVAMTTHSRELRDGPPRFGIARTTSGLVVGGACAASLLSSEFITDGSRQLYCFVGWVTTDMSVAAAPALDVLADGFVGWAKPTYDRYARLDWGRTEYELRAGSHKTMPGTAPWSPGSIGETGSLHGPSMLVQDALHQQLWPDGDAANLWAQVALSRSPVTASVGWATDNVPDYFNFATTTAVSEKVARTLASAQGVRSESASRPQPAREADSYSPNARVSRADLDRAISIAGDAAEKPDRDTPPKRGRRVNPFNALRQGAAYLGRRWRDAEADADNPPPAP